ncbi:MAG TPA: M20/M25/M40 family metallo-hydrolase [Candidatus Acidoferrum sp.]|nr:M20/M25/M40 family metallo-hydrolase [Candidatus Acidoferrum sp.]
MSGSPQAAAAAEYVRQQMLGLGLEVRLEPITVRHWVRGREEARLVRYPGQLIDTNQRLVITALGNSVPTPPGGVMAPLIIVETFEQLDRIPSDGVNGKVVLFNHPFDEFAAQAGRWADAYDLSVPYRSEGPSRAARKGAIAALVRSTGATGSRLAHTGVTKYADGVRRIPAGAVAGEDADLIADLASRGEVTIHVVLEPLDLPPITSHNVIADLKGSEFSEQIVIVSGHLDSWDLGTGALDDASGLGVAMDVLRIIKEINAKPKRTIRFVAWMDEENGGAGGRTYAEDHRTDLPNHIAAIELDYGDGRPLGLNVCASDERFGPLSAVLQAIVEPIGGVVRVSESPGVDLTAMSREGVPAISPLQDARRYFQYHHTAADTFDKVRPDELQRNLELIAPLVYALAQH